MSEAAVRRFALWACVSGGGRAGSSGSSADRHRRSDRASSPSPARSAARRNLPATRLPRNAWGPRARAARSAHIHNRFALRRALLPPEDLRLALDLVALILLTASSDLSPGMDMGVVSAHSWSSALAQAQSALETPNRSSRKCCGSPVCCGVRRDRPAAAGRSVQDHDLGRSAGGRNLISKRSAERRSGRDP